jgi:PAT family acetyl-CoA transporter-like MFS transporter 1
MVPAQLLIGAIMIFASGQMDSLLYGEEPAILHLTCIFLAMNFLCATQDIAVDGWALTLLRRENAAYQATCNAVGQTFGYTLGWTGVTLLEQMGLVDLPGFMYYTGVMFIAVTLVVAAVKTEEPVGKEDKPEGVAAAYRSIFGMLQLESIRTLIVVLFTWKLSFAVVDSVAPLKFIEYGVPKE